VPAGAISFPGVNIPISLTATRTLGTNPDYSKLVIVPQGTTPDSSGTSTLSFGFDGNLIVWSNCLCTRTTMEITPKGQVQVCEIADRRWKWQRGYVNGAYNVRNPDGTIDQTAPVANLQQLCVLMFAAMGETVLPDLTRVSTAEFPEVAWNYDNAAWTLEEMLTMRGYVISLNTDDTVTVYVRGQGIPVAGNSETVSLSINLSTPPPPFACGVLGDKTLVQSMLAMIPVGEDLDGSIKYVENLSYKPPLGWSGVDFNTFSNITNPVARQLALNTVGKMYQVASQADGTFDVSYANVDYASSSGELTVNSMSQCLPLEPYLLDTYTDRFGKIQRARPYVTGQFFNGTIAPIPQGANTPAFTRVDRREYTFDRTNGIILFRVPALKLLSGVIARAFSNLTFADVYLTCLYSIHDATLQIKDRMLVTQPLGGIGYDIRKNDAIQRQLVVQYQTGTNMVVGINDNKAQMTVAAQPMLAAIAAQYTAGAGKLQLDRGTIPYSTDGVTWQVMWDVDIKGKLAPFGTWIAQNFDGIPMLPTAADKATMRLARLQANVANRRLRGFRKARGRAGP
jgi:hypothetical protein